MPNSSKRQIVLAVSSGGGHWAELQRLRPAWEGAQVEYVVSDRAHRCDALDGRVHIVPDANARRILRLIWLAVAMAWIVARVRPDVVISTGAAPGFFALRVGKLLGARTVWIDSIANAEEMSASARLARLARKYSDLWLAQWPHVARRTGARYAGAVM